MRWVQHDCDGRVCKLESLLAAVRLTALAPCFLEQQLKHCPILKKQPRCLQTLAEKLNKLKLHEVCAAVWFCINYNMISTHDSC
jgi:kelch-like protein 19